MISCLKTIASSFTPGVPSHPSSSALDESTSLLYTIAIAIVNSVFR